MSEPHKAVFLSNASQCAEAAKRTLEFLLARKCRCAPAQYLESLCSPVHSFEPTSRLSPHLTPEARRRPALKPWQRPGHR